jgi:hypothetical protein
MRQDLRKKSIRKKYKLLELIEKVSVYTDINHIAWDKDKKICVISRKNKLDHSLTPDIESLYEFLKYNPKLFFSCIGFDPSVLKRSKTLYEALVAAFTTYMIFNPPIVNPTHAGGITRTYAYLNIKNEIISRNDITVNLCQFVGIEKE